MKSACYPLTHQSAISAFIHIIKSIQINSKDQDINCLGLISKNMSNQHALKKKVNCAANIIGQDKLQKVFYNFLANINLVLTERKTTLFSKIA